MTLSPANSLGGGRWLPFRNDSSEVIPAYAVVQLSGVTYVQGQHVWTAVKPNSTATVANTFFNGPTDIEAGSFGSCTADLPAWALISDPNAVVGQTAGPEPASWKLRVGTGAYEILGLEASADGKALVQRSNIPVSTGYGGGVGSAASFGCPPWDCNYKTGSLQTVSCTVCTQAPEYYRFWLTQDCNCCDGRIAPGGWVTLQYVSGCIWQSTSFDCVRTGGAVGGSCGAKIYRWDRWNSPGSPPTTCGTVKWKSVLTDKQGTITYVWDTMTGWNPTTTTGTCNAGTYSEPPYNGSSNGETVVRNCGVYEWQIESSNCGCGCTESSVPSQTPTEGATLTVDCVQGGSVPCPGGSEDVGYWQEIGGSCSCSSASAPTYPGTSFGQTVKVDCKAASSGGSQTAKWKLTIGSTTTLQLVAEDASVLLEYKMAFGRTFCCLCANAMQFTGPCGPFGCSGWPDLICVTPWRPPVPDCEDCPTAPEEYTLACSLFSSYTQPTIVLGTDAENGTQNLECQGGISAQYANGTFTLSLTETRTGLSDYFPFRPYVVYKYESPPFETTFYTGNGIYDENGYLTNTACVYVTGSGKWLLSVECTGGYIYPRLQVVGDFGVDPSIYPTIATFPHPNRTWIPVPASTPENLCGRHTSPWDLIVSPDGDPNGAVNWGGGDDPFYLSQSGNFLTLQPV